MIAKSRIRAGRNGIDAGGELIDAVAQRLVGAVDHDRDSRKDERVFRHRLPRVLRTTDSRARMNIFAANSIFVGSFSLANLRMLR